MTTEERQALNENHDSCRDPSQSKPPVASLEVPVHNEGCHGEPRTESAGDHGHQASERLHSPGMPGRTALLWPGSIGSSDGGRVASLPSEEPDRPWLHEGPQAAVARPYGQDPQGTLRDHRRRDEHRLPSKAGPWGDALAPPSLAVSPGLRGDAGHVWQTHGQDDQPGRPDRLAVPPMGREGDAESSGSRLAVGADGDVGSVGRVGGQSLRQQHVGEEERSGRDRLDHLGVHPGHRPGDLPEVAGGIADRERRTNSQGKPKVRFCQQHQCGAHPHPKGSEGQSQGLEGAGPG